MTDLQLPGEYTRSDSKEAFRRLMEQHIHLVYGTCRRTVRVHQLAQGATQAVFLLLAKKASGFREETSVSGWLYNTSRLVARNAVRQKVRISNKERALMKDDEANSSTASVSTEIEALLDEAIASLSQTDRDIVLMRFYDQLTFGEIAQELGAKEDTVGRPGLSGRS